MQFDFQFGKCFICNDDCGMEQACGQCMRQLSCGEVVAPVIPTNTTEPVCSYCNNITPLIEGRYDFGIRYCLNHKNQAQNDMKKYLILNCEYDNDIINYNGDELLEKINEYICLKNFNIIISNDNNKNLIPTKNIYNMINIPKLINNKKHNGFLIWKYILNDYYKINYNDNYIFDYDYTLYDKENKKISLENIKLLEQINNSIIITNNCITNILPIKNIDIYSNFSNIKNNDIILDNKYILDNDDILYIIKIIMTDTIIEKMLNELKDLRSYQHYWLAVRMINAAEWFGFRGGVRVVKRIAELETIIYGAPLND